MRTFKRLFAALLVSSTALGCSGCVQATDSPAAKDAKDAQAAAREPVAVSVARAQVQPVRRALKFVGTLYGEAEVTLSSQVEGQIKTVQVDLGDHIEAGQVLVEIDDEQLRARLREVEAQLAKARADEKRGRELASGRIISPVEYESMKTLSAVAEAQRDTLNVTIDRARVRSPLTGSVANRSVSAGEYVRAGTPLLKLIADQPLKLRGEVPERFAQELAVGQAVEIVVDAYPGRVFHGTLARISPSVSRESRSITVEALVDNAEQTLKAGFFANASILTRANEQAVLVPQKAVSMFAGVTKVFVVQNDVAHQTPVRLGTGGDHGLVEIAEGIAPDAVVVVSGFAKLEDGSPIRVQRPTASPAADGRKG